MENLCTLKFAISNPEEGVKIFTADFPKWNLPVVGDHILVNRNNGQAIFIVLGKTHVFEHGVFKEVLYAVSQQ